MSEIKLEHILVTVNDRKAISRWEMIFAGKEKPSNRIYPKSQYCYYSEINGRIFMHDADDRIILDFYTSVNEILFFLKYVNKIFFKYEYLKYSEIPWQKIGYEAVDLLNNDKQREIECKQRLLEEAESRKLEAQKLSSPTIPDIVHNVWAASQWIENAKFSSHSQSLYKNIWFEKEICLLFADSNIGKSILATQIACNIALNRKVVYFDYEMNAETFSDRFRGLFKLYPALSQNFIRCQPNPDLFLCDNAVNHILADISSIVQKHNAEVIVIDNITFINSNIKSNTRSARLIYNLKKIAVDFSLSMLVLAHSAKRNLNKPITQNDLAGSKALFNFADSAFAIGQSAVCNDTQYLKQLKSRSSKIVYGADNVILMHRVFSNEYLHFETIGHEKESNLLQPSKPSELLALKTIILNLEKEGYAQSKIAQILNISQSKVSRIKNL